MKSKDTDQYKYADRLAGLPYFSFLLRIWLVRNGEIPYWRFSLEDIRSGDVIGFETLQDLFSYLENSLHPPETAQPNLETS